MKKYLAFYENEWPANIAELTAIESKPFVGYLKGGEVLYTVVPAKEEEPEIDLTVPYVTFTAEEDNSSIGLSKKSLFQTLEYSTDTTTWNTFKTSTNISLNNGDKVYVRGILSKNNAPSNCTNFKMSGKIAASGNCNAIWNYQDLNAPLKARCGHKMFYDCTSLTVAPVLPATILALHCYEGMFRACTSLTTAPVLPATTLADDCYNSMFYGCTSLTTAPVLPATTLADDCYNSMFYGCTSLTTAPVLPATTLAVRCYSCMFDDCSSLTVAPELPATELANLCYYRVFYGCTSLTTAPVLPATTLAYGCYDNMFRDCTSLTTAPELPAMILAETCYSEMFSGCTNLNYIKCLATNISVTECTDNWVDGVTETGTFIKNPDMNSWSTGTSGIPSGWEVVDAEL